MSRVSNNERAARTTLELTLNPEYVKDWGVWEAIREFLQNALDAKDLGHEIKITYVTNTKLPQLRIITEGVMIDRDTLLLGTTSKSGRQDQRGEFGEGMKLACLVLVRKGLGVKIRSGNEQWVPRIDFSGNFNSDLLMVDTSPCKYRNSVQVDIIGLCETDWETIQSRILNLNKPKEKEIIRVGKYNNILKGKRFKNKLFVKGIYVGYLPGDYYFGYDLCDVSLDRDRRLADPWDLKSEIRKCLASATAEKKISTKTLFEILNGDYEENSAVADTYRSDIISTTITEYFVNEHGENAVPVSDTAQSVEAQQYGFKAVVVPRIIKNLIEREIGDFDSKKDNKKNDIQKRYSANELNINEEKNFIWAFKLIQAVEPAVDNLTVVDFFGENILGLFKDGEINIAKKIMMDRKEVIETVIHEAAHFYGKDGTKEHSDMRDEIAAKIIVHISENLDII